MLRSIKRFIDTHRYLLIAALFFFLSLLIPFLYWHIIPSTPLSIVVIDKTAGSDLQTHLSLFWLMQHWKYSNPETGKLYDERKDYYGYYPFDNSRSHCAQLNLSETTLLYIADTYGIYDYGMDPHEYEKQLPEMIIPGKLLYGGLRDEELLRIERYQASNRIMVGEYNSLHVRMDSSSMSDHPLSQFFDIRFTGALGSYHEDLRYAARWMKERYERMTGSLWNFTGRGFIIIIQRSEEDHRPEIVILQEDDMARNPVVIRTTEHEYLKGTEDEVPYFLHVEFLHPDSSAKVIASYEFRCTESGRRKMEEAGLPLVTPAVVVSGTNGQNIYCAGDFAENPTIPEILRIWNVEMPLKHLYSLYVVPDQTRFFWKFYMPMMKNILEKAVEFHPALITG